MQMETLGAVAGTYESKPVVKESSTLSVNTASAGQAVETMEITPVTNQMQNGTEPDANDGKVRAGKKSLQKAAWRLRCLY